jgi:hypothetical protein
MRMVSGPPAGSSPFPMSFSITLPFPKSDSLWFKLHIHIGPLMNTDGKNKEFPHVPPGIQARYLLQKQIKTG